MLGSLIKDLKALISYSVAQGYGGFVLKYNHVISSSSGLLEEKKSGASGYTIGEIAITGGDRFAAELNNCAEKLSADVKNGVGSGGGAIGLKTMVV